MIRSLRCIATSDHLPYGENLKLDDLMRERFNLSLFHCTGGLKPLDWYIKTDAVIVTSLRTL